MQFSISREAFLKPLKSISGVVERKASMNLPVLSNVLIQLRGSNFFLTTTDQEVELIAYGVLEEVTGEGSVTVSVRKLLDICRSLKEGAILSFIVEEDNRLIIRAGRSRFTLSTLSAEDFPNLDEEIGNKRFTLASEQLRHLIEQTSFAMAEQDVRYYLNGMLLEIKKNELIAVASDGHRLALAKMPLNVDGLDNFRIIIPRKGILELHRLLVECEGEITLCVGSNHLRVITEKITLTSKLLEGRYPDYERIIPQGGTHVLTGQKELLKEAFHRASSLFSDKFRAVRLKLSEGCLKILATTPEQDEVEEDIEVDYQGSELEIGFNVKYLIDLLNAIPTQSVAFTFSDSESSAKINGVEDKQGTYVIMPMRI